MVVVKLNLSGLSCSGCIKNVTRTLQNISGVKDVRITLTSAIVTTDNQSSDFVQKMISEIELLGFKAKHK
ncbi:MAG: heavy-metal-associated domain-containing protein [Candidatus Hodarchaeales archaeon]|jgi:copper chaperone CopZ